MSGSWIQTYTGKAIRPLDLDPTDIDPRDIAHSLANMCRFLGHCSVFYSVAEHSYRMSNLIEPRFAPHALLHDAAEAYLADVSRPIKHLLPQYMEAERRIMDAVSERFGLDWTLEAREAVRVADVRMLAAERIHLMKIEAPVWDSLDGVEPYDVPDLGIVVRYPEWIKMVFCCRMVELGLVSPEELRP